jgi:hypothetical protein
LTRGPVALLIATVVTAALPARAQAQIKGRVMVMVDTSGSMAWHFGDCLSAGGDSSPKAAFCDNGITGSTFTCAANVTCTATSGSPYWPVASLTNPSRLYVAKASLTNAINSASGELDFGLERYAVATAADLPLGYPTLCGDPARCCVSPAGTSTTTRGRCVPAAFSEAYPHVPGDANCYGAALTCDPSDPNCNACNLTWMGGCGTSLGCTSCTNTQGGEVLVTPGINSSAAILPWVDSVEDVCSSTNAAGGPPRNPELRAAGNTPLAGSVRSAGSQWYAPIYSVSKVGLGTYNPASPLFDAQLDCRSYVNVVMTDGIETCEDPSVAATDPITAVQQLANLNPTNPVKTYVIGLAFNQSELCSDATCPKSGPGGGCTTVGGVSYCSCSTSANCGTTCDGVQYTCGSDQVCHHPAVTTLNQMAAAGGTGAARFANNESDVEAVFADIVASTVKFETCNGADDNCNGLVDEGLGMYTDCTPGQKCPTATGSQTCDATGRCPCTTDAQCNSGGATGNLCSAGLCQPACTAGLNACAQTGVRRCGAGGTQCCARTSPAGSCVPLNAMSSSAETCNGIDDDCNGVVDDCVPNLTGSCCVDGGCTPRAETCDGLDDNCNGQTDEPSQLVDTNRPCGSPAIGACVPGVTVCVNSAGAPISSGGVNADPSDHLICQGGTGVRAEQCNGCDFDCNGVRDAPIEYCYSGSPATAGVGACHGGVQSCTTSVCSSAATWGACVGEVLPSTEICDGIDNDCDGTTDDVPDAGMACCRWGSCGIGACAAGTWACVGGAPACVGGVAASTEICDGLDNDCNSMTDDVPGVGLGCRTTGGCPGTTACDVTRKQVVCRASTGGVEICNGIDDDCDGLVDDAASIARNDSRVGVACGGCGGVTRCQGGAVVCVQVTASSEVCNGRDDDCNGLTDEGATCAGGLDCVNGSCLGRCDAGCPGGYACDATGHCAPGACQCGACEKCRAGLCIDVCADVDCGPGYSCSCGSCVPGPDCDGGTGAGGGSAGGVADSGTGGGGGMQTRGCGCAETNGAGTMLALLTLWLLRRRGRAARAVTAAIGLSVGTTACLEGSAPQPGPGISRAALCEAFDASTCTDSELASDPDNCGSCGNVCTFPHAAGLCLDGGCVMGPCAYGYEDLDASTPGCEYACVPTSPPTEVCDGRDNDCNGTVDDGCAFANDPGNCGTYGNVCRFPNAGARCVGGACALGACDAGFKDLDDAGADGCEYACPVSPPTAELCNGLDDDCNGLIDDAPTDVGGACSTHCPAPNPCVAAGTCTSATSSCAGGCCGACAPGVLTCSGSKVCSGGVRPIAEVCNGLDDNCDGQIDEAFDTRSDPHNCGSCGRVCSAPHAYSGCSNGACTITGCVAGYANLDGIVGNGCEYACPVSPPMPETCNGLDDNCNGQTDEGLVAPPGFCTTAGPCAAAVASCFGANGWKCNYSTLAGVETDSSGNLALTETLCDGIDGNCNGTTDESFPAKGQVCRAGLGACAANGTYICAGNKLSTACNATPNLAAAVDELCNGLDDNCDGQTDERTPLGGTCTNGAPHLCLGWADPMARVVNNGTSFYIYRYEASRVDATATAAGASSARACSNANVLPWASVSNTSAAAACAAVRDSSGAPMRLCTQAEWEAACAVGIGMSAAGAACGPGQPPCVAGSVCLAGHCSPSPAPNVWSFSANPTIYVGTTCNTFDLNVGKATATGSLAACLANPANQSNGVTLTSSVFDLTGNVGEWTSTSGAADGGSSYFKVRGGTFHTFNLGAACYFDFTMYPPTLQLPDLGFRCCSNNAP